MDDDNDLAERQVRKRLVGGGAAVRIAFEATLGTGPLLLA
jgi:hypothetical protein